MVVVDSDLESFHRSKIDKVYKWKSKLEKQIEIQQHDSVPILVPDGVQVQSKLFVPKPLHCYLYTSSATADNYIAHYGAGPENGICTWTKESNESKIRKQKKDLDCRIKEFVYVSASYLVFAACDDLTVRIYGNQFREHCRLQVQYSILSMLYDESIGIITGCVGKVQAWKLNSCLHKPPLVSQEVILHDDHSGVTPWLTYLYHYKERKQIIALSGTGIFFLAATSLQQLMFLENRHNFPLTICITYSPREYLITASKKGEIKIWNMSMLSYPYVGCFKGHMKRIIKLYIHPTEQLLISSSEDSTIRLWRMETFHETYRFDVLDSIVNMTLVNPKTLIYTSQTSICILDLNLFHSLFTLIGSRVTDINRVDPSFKASRILLVAADGGARVISPVHGNILTMVFPVVTHKPILYKHDPVEERVYVLLEEGSVMVISTKTNPCSTEYLWEGQHADERVICMEMLFMKTEKISILLGYHTDGRLSALSCKGYTMKHFSPNRGMIKLIKACHSPLHYDFITYSTENTITLWKMKINKRMKELSVAMVEDMQLNQIPSHIALLSNAVVVAHDKRLTFYQCKQKNQKISSFQIFQHTKDEMHSSVISDLTSCPSISLIASASSDGRVKIWGSSCNLLRELSFDATLVGLSFSNNRGDLLVGFQNNLHYVSSTEYLPTNYLEKLLKCSIIDETIDYCIPFDPSLKFWYDANRVKTISLLATNKQSSHDMKPSISPSFHAINSIAPSRKDLSLKLNRICKSTMQMHHFYGAMKTSKNQKKQSKLNVTSTLTKSSKLNVTSTLTKESKLNATKPSKLNVNTILAKQSVKMMNDQQHEIEKILDVLGNEDVMVEEPPVISSIQPELPVKKFWPCAPDCYIPNSIVRKSVQPKLAEVPVEPWKPKMFFEEREYIYNDGDFDDEFNDKTRTWHSGEEESDIGYTDDWLDFEVSSKKPNLLKRKKSKEKKAKPQKIIKKKEKLKPSMKKELPPAKITRFQPAKQEEIKEEESEEDNFQIEESDDENKIPPPFDKYYEKSWFPRDIGFDVNTITLSLLTKLDRVAPLLLKEILRCVVDIHKVLQLPELTYEKVLAKLFHLLENPSGQIRHYTVNTLYLLGANRKEVILKLVAKLDDPVAVVREQVKMALKEMAGIRDADTLIQTLKDLGEFRETVLADDKTVIESYREQISKRGDALRERLAALNERDARLTAQLNDMQRPSIYANKERSARPEIMLPSSTNRKQNSSEDDDIELESTSTSQTKTLQLDELSKELQKEEHCMKELEESKLNKKEISGHQSRDIDQVHKPEESRMSEQINGGINNDQLNVYEDGASIKFTVPSLYQRAIDSNEEHVTAKIANEVEKRKTNALGDNKEISSKINIKSGESKVEHNYNPSTMTSRNDSYIKHGQHQGHLQQPKMKNSVTNEYIQQNAKNENNSALRYLNPETTCEKPLFTPSSKEIYQLNRLLFQSTEATIENTILAIAPMMFNKFNTTDTDLLRAISKEEPPVSSTTSSKDTLLSNSKYESVNKRKDCLTRLQNLRSLSNSQDGTDSSIKSNSLDSSTDIKAVQTVEAMVLATAFSALRVKRKNITALPKHGIIGNETLNDINMLLKLIQNKGKLNASSVKEIMDLVTGMQQDIDWRESALESQSLIQDEAIIDCNNQIECDLVQGVCGERIDLVQGVCGERIVQSLNMVGTNNHSKKYTQIRAIPERHGNFTVYQQKGVTKYGVVQYHWTTLTRAYDMSSTKRKAIMKQKSIANQLRLETKLEQARCSMSEHLKSKWLPMTRLNNTPIAERPKECSWSKHPVLPKIGRLSAVEDGHKKPQSVAF